MTETLAGPCLQVFDRLGGFGAVQQAPQVLTSDDA